MASPARRIAITGMGIASCLGNDLDTVSAALRAGRPGIRFLPDHAEHGLRSQVGGAVDSAADTVEPIVRGTMYGPTLRTPRARRMSAVSTCQWLEPPPEPAIRPVRGSPTCSSVRPASAIASRMAT